MIKQRQIKVFLILGLLFLIAGCATTKTTEVWKDPAFNKTILKNVIVIGVAERDANRRVFEDEFVKQLQKKNINAIASYTMFSLDEARKDRDAVKSQIMQKNIDVVIVTRMIDKTTEEKYYPSRGGYSPPSIYYNGWYSYYSISYSPFHSPGYTKTYDVVKLECNVYDIKKEKLVFSGLSDTTIKRGVETKASKIVKGLIKNILSK